MFWETTKAIFPESDFKGVYKANKLQRQSYEGTEALVL